MASQLHQQAIAAYMSVTSFAAATERAGPGATGSSAGALIGGDLKDRADTVELRISDDGLGFDPVTTPAAAGIATMHAAAGALDGQVTVESTPGGGTTVVATLGPLGDPGPAAEPEPSSTATSPRLRVVPPLQPDR